MNLCINKKDENGMVVVIEKHEDHPRKGEGGRVSMTRLGVRGGMRVGVISYGTLPLSRLDEGRSVCSLVADVE